MENTIRIVRDRHPGIEIVPEIEEVADCFRAEIIIEDRDRGPQSAIELSLTAAIALFIATSLFSSMLTAIGTAAGNAIVNFIQRQFKASKSVNVRMYTRDEHNQLAAAHPNVSGDRQQYDALCNALGRPLAPLEITIRDEHNPLVRLRLIFPVDMDESDVPIAIEKLALNQAYLASKLNVMVTTWQDALVYVRDQKRWVELSELIRDQRKREAVIRNRDRASE